MYKRQGVHGPGIHKEQVSSGDRQDLQALFQGAVEHAVPDLIEGDTALEAEGHLGVALGRQRIPALRFAVGLAIFAGDPIVWVYLDAQLFLGKEDFDQQRRAGMGSFLACLLYTSRCV